MNRSGLLVCTLLAVSSSVAFAQNAAAAKETSIPRLEDLKYPALPEIKIPEVTEFTLPNGMRVFLLENHELPLVGGSALIRTGNLFESANAVGLSSVMANVLRTGGTQARTGDELDQILESMASAVESNMGETSASVSFNTLTENTDQVLAIFKEVLTKPAFRQDKIDLVKTQLRSSIARRNDESPQIASREFASIVYGRNNPYGWQMEYEHLENIDREDLIKFYERYYFPANIRLAIQGDFKTGEMRAKLEKLFADWTVKQEPVPAFPPVPATKSAGVYLAEKPDVNQTQFRLGHQGEVLMKHPDYPALSVMSDILGGGFASRLFLNVRTRGGLAYSVGGGYGANYGHPGLFRISGSTKSESSVQAIGAAILEVEKLRNSEVTDKELDTAKESVMNSFVFYFDHPREVLNRYVVYDYWGYPKDFLFQYQKGIRSVTKPDIQRVAKQYLHPDKLTIVAVGNPKEFGTPLAKLGEVKTIDLTIPEPGQKQAPSDAASVQRGKERLQRAQAAMGGAEKLTAIKDITTVSRTKLNTPQGAIELAVTSQIIRPGTARVTQETPVGKIILFTDGKSYWMSSPQGTSDQVPPPVAKQIRGELFRDLPSLVLSDRVPGRTIAAVGENEIQISDGDGESVRLQIDAQTGLPSGMHYSGGQGPSTSTYSDWRDVEGVKLPFQRSAKVGPMDGVSTVSEIKINTGLSAEALSKKP